MHAKLKPNATDLFSQDVSVEEAGQVRSDCLGVQRLEIGEAERQPLTLGRRQPLGEGLLKSHMMSHSVKVKNGHRRNTKSMQEEEGIVLHQSLPVPRVLHLWTN